MNGIQPGHPATALLALVLGLLAVKAAYQRSREAGNLVFMFVSGVFAAVLLFVLVNGMPHP
jgi:hypothetical protein